MFSGGHLIILTLTGLVVFLSILVHFEALSTLTGWLPKLEIRSRPRIIVLMFSLLLVHILEIWLFAFAYIGARAAGGAGLLRSTELGTFHEGFLDYVYYSAVVYTSLGFGDMVPMGAFRFLSAMEALTGLMMIGWSSSFVYIEMQRFWKQE